MTEAEVNERKRERDKFEETLLLALKMEAHRPRKLLEAREGKETNSPLGPSDGRQLY